MATDPEDPVQSIPTPSPSNQSDAIGFIGLRRLLSSPSTSVEKRYTSAFVLDRAKLARILNVVTERLSQAPNRSTESQTSPRVQYEVMLRSGKELSFQSSEEVLQLDNTLRDPIEDLTIEARSRNAERSCKLSFSAKKITLRVAGLDIKDSNEIFAIIDEQLERTFEKGFMYKIGKLEGLLLDSTVMPLLFLLLVLVTVGVTSQKALSGHVDGTVFLEADIEHLKEQLLKAHTADEKVSALVAVQMASLNRTREYYQPSPVALLAKKMMTVRMGFLAAPFIIIVVCFLYLLAKCYPSAVFLWGDIEAQYNQKTLKTRDVLWGVIVLGLIVELLGNMFSYALSM